MQKRLAALSAMAIAVTFAFVPGTVTAGFTLNSTMQAAANARQVPLPLLKAITYVNTRWELIIGPAGNGGYGLMNILPSQLARAASLSQHSAIQITTDPAANLDAGAALLASANSGATDLASWQPATALTLGPVVATQVYDALRSGESRTTSYGELITLAPQRLPAPSPSSALGVGSGATVSGGAALAPATTTTAGADYPLAAWVPASPANFSTAKRPRDYPVDMIIIHDIEGSYGSAIQEFQDPAAQASAHYVVSDLGQITQMVAEHDVAWHAGNWDYNTRAIGIEHEGYATGTNWYTPAMYDASARLSASICSRWGVPMDRAHVIGHYEVPDPNNPGLFGGAGHHTDPGTNWNWPYYMNLAQQYASGLPSLPHLVLAATAVAGDRSVALYWPSARTCYAPITGYTVTAQPGNVVLQMPATATTTTINGLQNGISYTFTVTAQNSAGQDAVTSNPATPAPLPFAGLYTLDAYGGIHGDSSSPLAASAYWSGWRIARAAKTLPTVSGPPRTGFLLDGWGGLHTIGTSLVETSPSSSHYWPGWDIARDLAFLPDGSGGFVLDGYGGLHPFRVGGNAAPLAATGFTYWGWDIARKVVIAADGKGGYVLDGWGGLHSFGINGPPPASLGPLAGNGYWAGQDLARDIALVPGNGGYSGYVLDAYGGIHPFHPTGDGSAMPLAIHGTYWGWDIARGFWLAGSSTAAAPKGYVLDGYGGVTQFGSVSTPGFTYWPGWDVAIGLLGQ